MTFPGETNSWPGSRNILALHSRLKPVQPFSAKLGLGLGAYGKTWCPWEDAHRIVRLGWREEQLSALDIQCWLGHQWSDALLPTNPWAGCFTPRNGPDKPLAQHHQGSRLISCVSPEECGCSFDWTVTENSSPLPPERIMPWNTAEPQKAGPFLSPALSLPRWLQKKHTEQRARHLVCT